MLKKLAIAVPFLLFMFGGMPAFGQSSPEFTNIVIIVQENRTPDNLFQDSNLIANGADILPGYGLTGAAANARCELTAPSGAYLYPYASLGACFDPDHLHYTAFNTAYDGGNWDGSCSTSFIIVNSSCFETSYSGAYPNYTYVPNYPISGSSCPCILDPYYEIAEDYGFANYMFQTNEGPSYPAHQFLFSGTSAPVAYDGDSGHNYEMYAAEIPFTGDTYGEHAESDLKNYAGCASYWDTYDSMNGHYYWTQEYDLKSFDSGDEDFFYSPPSVSQIGFPCYDHPSMGDALDNAEYTWRYYVQDEGQDNRIWAAPNSLSAICPVNPGGACSASTGNGDWANVDHNMGDILNDIHNCNLKNVSWVIPDGFWSDHPGEGTGADDGGPSWVAAIVNAIGGADANFSPSSSCNGGDSKMYWNGSQKTLVLITWDDWGGWYDHVKPPNVSFFDNGATEGFANKGGDFDSTDGDYYVYGFRVPLLVVSTYTKTGYISGPTVDNVASNLAPPYIHDFGSILGFIEWNFGLSPYDGGSGCGIATLASSGCDYEFADYFAPDGKYECSFYDNCGESVVYPLEDFFDFSRTNDTFTSISGAKYASDCFVTSATTCFSGFSPSDPDDDVSEEEE